MVGPLMTAIGAIINTMADLRPPVGNTGHELRLSCGVGDPQTVVTRRKSSGYPLDEIVPVMGDQGEGNHDLDEGSAGDDAQVSIFGHSSGHPSELTYWLEAACNQQGSELFSNLYFSVPQVVLIAAAFALYECLPLWFPLRWERFQPRLRVERMSMRITAFLVVCTAVLAGLSMFSYISEALRWRPDRFSVPCSLLLLGPLPLLYPPLLLSYLLLKALWNRILLSDTVIEYEIASVWRPNQPENPVLVAQVRLAQFAYLAVQGTLHTILLASRLCAILLYAASLFVSCFLCEFFFLFFWLLIQPGVSTRKAGSRQEQDDSSVANRLLDGLQENQQLARDRHAQVLEVLLHRQHEEQWEPHQHLLHKPSVGKERRRAERRQRRQLFGGPSWVKLLAANRGARGNVVWALTLAVHNTIFSVFLVPPLRESWNQAWRAILVEGWVGFRVFQWWHPALWTVPLSAKLHQSWGWQQRGAGQIALQGLLLVGLLHYAAQSSLLAWSAFLKEVPDQVDPRNGRRVSHIQRQESALHHMLVEQLCLDVAEIIMQYDDREPEHAPARDFLVSSPDGLAAAVGRNTWLALPGSSRLRDVLSSVV
eukprot:g37524.t1